MVVIVAARGRPPNGELRSRAAPVRLRPVAPRAIAAEDQIVDASVVGVVAAPGAGDRVLEERQRRGLGPCRGRSGIPRYASRARRRTPRWRRRPARPLRIDRPPRRRRGTSSRRCSCPPPSCTARCTRQGRCRSRGTARNTPRRSPPSPRPPARHTPRRRIRSPLQSLSLSHPSLPLGSLQEDATRAAISDANDTSRETPLMVPTPSPPDLPHASRVRAAWRTPLGPAKSNPPRRFRPISCTIGQPLRLRLAPPLGAKTPPLCRASRSRRWIPGKDARGQSG